MRGLSVNQLTITLRSEHGHAYRRADMLVDLRLYREAIVVSEPIGTATQVVRVASNAASDVMSAANGMMSAANEVAAEVVNVALSVTQSAPRWLGLGPTIARAGVAAFAIALLVPTLVGATHARSHVLVADTSEARAATEARGEFSLPNMVADLPRRLATLAPTPAPTPEPTPAPTPTPLRFVAGGPAVIVTASWYGPGFFENRLPCWQWLQANGLPIQFLPDTWGVAHKTLPCGTMLVLTHGPNTITVPVVDRGPYVAGRELDLSPRIKAALGCTDLCTVLMQIK